MSSTTASAGNPLESGWAHAAYVLGLAAVALALPPAAYAHTSGHFLIVLGLIGAWRYGWGLLHFVRSIYYRRVDYPRLLAAARSAGRGITPPRAFLLVTSFRIDAGTTLRVYRAAIQAAKNAKGPTVIVASIVEMADQRLIKSLFDQMVSDEHHVELVFVRIAGTGKRDALAYGFRAIARRNPEADDLVAVIDGDSIVPPDLIEKCAPFFLLDQRIGALTTDEQCEVEGRPIYKEWWALRFAQRHVLMSSMGLARRVLTLTGRMSMFRASIVRDPTFIAQVELDYIDHWRIGRFKFLTGDDKSSWFWLLKRGYQMLYLPDVQVVTVEQPPADNFVTSAGMLMVRWFGNMLRTNGRAVALGPKTIGLFTWWSIVDQRFSMWTCLIGVVFAGLGTVFVTPYAIVFYAVWILASRYLVALSLFSARPRVSIAYPFLLYFNQIFGSLVKTYIFFRLDQQKWTRQKTITTRNLSSLGKSLIRVGSLYMHVLSMALFFLTVGVFMGVFAVPRYWTVLGFAF
jgi:glycosyltransferase Alg8